MLLPSNSKNDFSNTAGEAEQFIQSALDALSAHVAILDEEGNIIGVNAAWRQFATMNAYSAPDYGIGINYLAVCDASAALNSNDAPVVADAIRDIIAGKKSEFRLEYPCHSPYEKRWFVVRISHFQWYDHLRIIVAHQNVSELKRFQIELSESKRRTEAIIDNVNNGILTLTQQGIIQTANRASARIFGYAVDDLIGLHIETLMTQKFDDELSFRQLNEHSHEITGVRKDGGQFPMSLSLNRLQLDDGSIYTCIIQDITYRKRMEIEIIEREKMQVALDKERELRVLKNRFLSMMGHELNTPLASISLSYDMLKKYSDVSTPEENAQALDNIQQQVGHLRDMVKDVMTISRSEAEGISMNMEKVNLITYCDDMVEEFHFIHNKTHSVDFYCEEPGIFAQIDRRLLRRALTNLLSNAIKYSPQGGIVHFYLGLNRTGDTAIIKVRDSGLGIPQEDHARLFEPFHRAANADGLPGTGLGLAIVKQAIELHKGTINFETEMGKGTIFIIHLPLNLED